MEIKGLAAAVFCVFASQSAASPLFTNISEPLGIDHTYVGGWEHFVGGGVATFDCNGDDLPELFIAGGETAAVLLKNNSGADLAFKEETPKSLQLEGVVGAYPIDLDNDHITDMMILRVGENKLMRGRPDCQFAPFEDIGFDGGAAWSTAFSATWEDGQTLPTLAIGNYVDRDNPAGPFETCDKNQLLRPDHGRYGESIALEPGYCALSILFSDWGRAGAQDLRVSNDRHYYVRQGHEQLWAMEEPPRLYSQDDGWTPHKLWGMGIASRDISGDGFPEVMLTSMGDQRLQQLEGDKSRPSYRDADFDRGTSAHRPYVGDDGRPSTGWHAEFGDIDNDGRDDLFIAKGNVEQMPGSAMTDPNNLLMQTSTGQFAEAGDAAGVASMHRSRGASVTDLNLDGRLDLVVVNRRAPLEIYQNVTQAGNWLLIEVSQDGVNTDAVGAWIEVETNERRWHREVTIGGGHASGSLGFHHFGLGETAEARVRITWPDGQITGWRDVPPNRIARIRR